ncbi:MAG: RNA-binding protein [Candidatus Aenigmarchaeota archaeon]|nr:RNA-binding protein [Candidatus Aenigmarchaeota archaeon]
MGNYLGDNDASSRPFTELDQAKGRRVIIKLKGGEEINGILKSFDQHLNIWLEDADENSAQVNRKLGDVLVRGDNIILISPSK